MLVPNDLIRIGQRQPYKRKLIRFERKHIWGNPKWTKVFPADINSETLERHDLKSVISEQIKSMSTSYNKRPVGLSSFVNCPPVVASFLTQRQLSINAGWQHMGRVPHPNYVDPECYVATVCHHVRFMYWEHLGHFQRAISHLKWHKIVCMRYLACAFSQMKSTDMFSMYLQSGVPRHFIWWFIAGWT